MVDNIRLDPTRAGAIYNPDYPGYYELSLYGRQIQIMNKQYNNTDTTLSLPGEDRIVFADELYQNVVNLLEHFAGSSSPRRPTIGQLWYDVSERRLKVLNANATWDPVSPTTGVNMGSGIGIYKGTEINQYGSNELQIKTLASGKNIIITPDDTSLTISTTSTNILGDNIGSGQGETYVKISDAGNLQVRSIQGGGNGNLLVHYPYLDPVKSIEMAEADANEIVIECTGEINRGCNVGCDPTQVPTMDIFHGNDGSQLIFRTLLPGKNINLSMYDKCDSILVSTTAESNAGINVGCGEGRIYARKVDEQLQFRRLVPGLNVQMSWECVGDSGYSNNLGDTLVIKAIGSNVHGVNVGCGAIPLYAGLDPFDSETLMFNTLQAGKHIEISTEPVTLSSTVVSYDLRIKATTDFSKVSLESLKNVSTIKPTYGQVLMYRNGIWKPETIPGFGCVSVGHFSLPDPPPPSWFYSVEIRWTLHKSYSLDAQPKLRLKMFDTLTQQYSTATWKTKFINGYPYVSLNSTLNNYTARTITNDLGQVIKVQGFAGFVVSYGQYSYKDVDHTFYVEFDDGSTDTGTVQYEIWFSKIGHYITDDSIESEMADWIGISYNAYGDPVETVMSEKVEIIPNYGESIIYDFSSTNSKLMDVSTISIAPLPPQYLDGTFKFILNFTDQTPDSLQHVNYSIVISTGHKDSYGTLANFVRQSQVIEFDSGITTYELDIYVDVSTVPLGKNIYFTVSLSNPTNQILIDSNNSSVTTAYYTEIIIAIEAPTPQYKDSTFVFTIKFSTPIINNEYVTYKINGDSKNFISPMTGVINFTTGIISYDLTIELDPTSVPDQENLPFSVTLSKPSSGIVLNTSVIASTEYYTQDNIIVLYPPGRYPIDDPAPTPPDPPTIEGNPGVGMFKFILDFSYPLIDDQQFITYTISRPTLPPTGLTPEENMVPIMEPVLGTGYDLIAMAWSGNNFCAIDANSDITLESQSGADWHQYKLPKSTQWTAIAWNGGAFCAISVGQNSAMSPDGITDWVAGTLPALGTWSSISALGPLFCAIVTDPNDSGNGINGNIAATSADGVHWTLRNLPSLPDSFSWNVISSNTTIFCIVSNSTLSATSSDGIHWTVGNKLPQTLSTWTSMAWDGANFCVIGDTGNAALSPDGINWTINNLPITAAWKSITSDGNKFCAFASNTSIAITSLDGIVWTPRTLPNKAEWSSVVWNGSIFYAISTGNSTIAASSPDGIKWTRILLPRLGGTAGDFDSPMEDTIYFKQGIRYYELIIHVKQNIIIEHSKYFVLTLSNPSNALLLDIDPKKHWVQTKITNDDFAIANLFVIGGNVKDEGSTFSFEIRLDRPLTSDRGNSQSIDWEVDTTIGSTRSSDFGLKSGKPSGTVTFGLNQLSATFDISTIVDTTRGRNRTFVVNLKAPTPPKYPDPLFQTGPYNSIKCTILNTYIGHKAVFFSLCKRNPNNTALTLKQEGYNVKINSGTLQVRRYDLISGTVYDVGDQEIIQKEITQLETINPTFIGPTFPKTEKIESTTLSMKLINKPNVGFSYSMSEKIITEPKYTNSYISNYNNASEGNYTSIDYTIPANTVYVNLSKSNKPFLISIINPKIDKIISSINFVNVKVTVIKSPPMKYKSSPTSKSNLIGSSLYQTNKKYISTTPKLNKINTQPSTNSSLMDILNQSDTSGVVAWASYGYAYDTVKQKGLIDKYGTRNIQDITFTPYTSIVSFLNDNVDPYSVVVSGQANAVIDNKELSWYVRSLDKNRIEITAWGTYDGGTTYEIVYPLETMVGIFGLKIRYSQRELGININPMIADTYWNYVVCLFNFNSTITDVKRHTVTNKGCVLTTDGDGIGKWGKSLILLNSHFVVGDNTLFNMDQLDFTIEFWYKDNGTKTEAILLWPGYNVNVNSWKVTITNGKMCFSATDNNSNWNICNNMICGPVSTGWNFYAISRESNRIRAYTNAIFQGYTQTTKAFAKTNSGLYVGGGYTNKTWQNANGVIDDLRISVGIARYALEVKSPGTNFDVPTGPWPMGSGY